MVIYVDELTLEYLSTFADNENQLKVFDKIQSEYHHSITTLSSQYELFIHIWKEHTSNCVCRRWPIEKVESPRGCEGYLNGMRSCQVNLSTVKEELFISTSKTADEIWQYYSNPKSR